jgi:hypothetical protein
MAGFNRVAALDFSTGAGVGALILLVGLVVDSVVGAEGTGVL